MADTMLDIVNEQDEVIGQALRSEIHAKGLLHREVNIWFVTPDKKIILQKRSMSKDTNPGKYAPAAGGHVESGDTYQDTAIAEIAEETGLVINASDIHLLTIYRRKPSVDAITGNTNNAIRHIYGYVLHQPVKSLEVEEGEIDGFIPVDIDALDHPSASGLIDNAPSEYAFIRDALVHFIEKHAVA